MLVLYNSAALMKLYYSDVIANTYQRHPKALVGMGLANLLPEIYRFQSEISLLPPIWFLQDAYKKSGS